MKSTSLRFGLLAALLISLSGCSGGGGGGVVGGGAGGGVVPGDPNLMQNAQAPWNALLAIDPALPLVTINSPPVVNFAVVDSDGRHVPGLKLIGGDAACGGNNVQMGIAKHDGVNWQSLISRQRYAVDGAEQYAVVEGAADPLPTDTIVNPGTALADPATRVVGILEEHAVAGYYTYHFATDVTVPLLLSDAVEGRNVTPGKLANNGKLAVKDGVTVHRVGMQLCFVDPQTQATVRVNSHLDFTLDGVTGAAQPIIDSQSKLTEARKVVDKSSCNECHQTLAARHDDKWVDPNVCVICHNSGSNDYITGKTLDLKFMVHRIHKGKDLANDYKIGNFVAKAGTTGVKFPQELRNCVKCHDSAKAKDAGNWNLKPSRNACWACHDNYADAGNPNSWFKKHEIFGPILIGPGVALTVDNLDTIQDSACGTCHSVITTLFPAAVHTIPAWINGEKYQHNIHDVSWNSDRTVSVEFSVSNPLNGSTYDILAPSSAPAFANLTVLFGWGAGDYTNAGAVDTFGVPVGQGQPVSISAASAERVGTSNRFRVTSTVVPEAASGTGVVALHGGIRLENNGLPYTAPVNDAVQYFAIGSGVPVPRRTVVEAEKCNACHGRNLNMNNHVDSHGGNVTDPEVCVICHNGNSMLAAPLADGDQSAHFKRLIHRKHKALGMYFPAMPSKLADRPGRYEGYTGVKNCNVCHVDKSYTRNVGVMGSKTTLLSDLVISPKAAVCSSCHDNTEAKEHMINAGGAVFSSVGGSNLQGDRNVTQSQIAAGEVIEGCDNCHTAGNLAPLDVKHGLP